MKNYLRVVLFAFIVNIQTARRGEGLCFIICIKRNTKVGLHKATKALFKIQQVYRDESASKAISLVVCTPYSEHKPVLYHFS